MNEEKILQIPMQNDELKITRTFEGYLGMESDSLFQDTESPHCRAFVKRMLSVPGIEDIKISPITNRALVCYDGSLLGEGSVLDVVFNEDLIVRPKDSPVSTIDYCKPRAIACTSEEEFAIEKDLTSHWQVVHDTPGRVRIRNPILYLRKKCCKEIEKAVYNTVGVKRVKANHRTTGVLIEYDAAQITKVQLLAILESVLQALTYEDLKSKEPRLDRFAVSTLSLGVNAAAMLFPPLMPVGVGLTVYNAWPIFKNAISALRGQEIKVDVLDAALISTCLLHGQSLAATFDLWILDIADALLDSGIEETQSSLNSAFGKKPRFVHVMTNGTEELKPLDRVEHGDIVVVSTGEAIPIDGKVCEGLGMVDQHILTGESAPIEKSVGDDVLASTILLAGKLHVEVEGVGEQTTEGKIVKIISESANYKSKVQNTGEKIADTMVVPTIGLATAGLITQGPSAFAAIINSDFGTGIRIAAPTAVLAYISKAARNGIVIKNGSILETLTNVDTFMFDKTGTLTRTIPKVEEIIRTEAFDKQTVLSYAAAAEQRFTHPIAKAILRKAEELELELPERDESKYNVGFGIEVVVNGDETKVGSTRFMQREGITIPSWIEERIDNTQQQGRSVVLVAINDTLAGVLELGASNRPEAVEVVQTLKQRGKEVILISGDHREPTRQFAQQVGIDRWYAEVLPQDKANFVREAQAEGKKVAFVGDGVNDSVALSLADVSISLGSASDIAQETADVIFIHGGLTKLNALYDISARLQKNIKRSWELLLYPNSACILGALFGVLGLGTSLILNNVFIFLSILNASLALDSKD